MSVILIRLNPLLYDEAGIPIKLKVISDKAAFCSLVGPWGFSTLTDFQHPVLRKICLRLVGANGSVRSPLLAEEVSYNWTRKTDH